MLEKLKKIFTIPKNPVADFLGYTWIDTKYFILDNWMFVHFGSGMAIGYLAKFFKFLENPLYVFLLLLLYELFEMFLWGYAFKQERAVNIIWDLVFGMAGYFLMRYLVS